jgi:hypothetical protein
LFSGKDPSLRKAIGPFVPTSEASLDDAIISKVIESCLDELQLTWSDFYAMTPSQ